MFSVIYFILLILIFSGLSLCLADISGGSSPNSIFKTAREKHRSVTAEDAAQAVVDVEKAMRSHASKQPSCNKAFVPTSVARGSKTLGWFLDNDIFEKKGNQVKTESSSNKTSEEKKKRRGPKKVLKKTADVVSEGSVASEDCADDMSKHGMAGDYANTKDDYFVYDVASDGYYYEQGSAKGWRRRQSIPPVLQQKVKEQEMESKINGAKCSSAQIQLQAAATRALLQAAVMNHTPFKYYDPSSDGYFYEMASVDGWKKRLPPQTSSRAQPMSPRASASTTSYGAALAKGQMPRNCIIDDSSASSSVSEDPSQDPFGLDSGFLMVERLFRPDSLNLDTNDQILPSFNADKFIQDLSFSGIDYSKISGFGTRSSHEEPTWGTYGLANPDSEDIEMGKLLKGLENIWANPNPTSVDKV